jgi:hypothetical protein
VDMIGEDRRVVGGRREKNKCFGCGEDVGFY